MNTTFHHVGLSVRDLAKSKKFYEQLGFTEVHRWDSEGGNLAIIHLKLGEVILELFVNTANANTNRIDQDLATYMSDIGIKHFGLRVPNIHDCYEQMTKAGYEIGNAEVVKGRTNVDYFFVKDPDGMWVEIVQDDRGY